jgi:hypothetical protein
VSKTVSKTAFVLYANTSSVFLYLNDAVTFSSWMTVHMSLTTPSLVLPTSHCACHMTPTLMISLRNDDCNHDKPRKHLRTVACNDLSSYVLSLLSHLTPPSMPSPNSARSHHKEGTQVRIDHEPRPLYFETPYCCNSAMQSAIQSFLLISGKTRCTAVEERPLSSTCTVAISVYVARATMRVWCLSTSRNIVYTVIKAFTTTF